MLSVAGFIHSLVDLGFRELNTVSKSFVIVLVFFLFPNVLASSESSGACKNSLMAKIFYIVRNLRLF